MSAVVLRDRTLADGLSFTAGRMPAAPGLARDKFPIPRARVAFAKPLQRKILRVISSPLIFFNWLGFWSGVWGLV
jgi:hypothetical protein